MAANVVLSYLRSDRVANGAFEMDIMRFPSYEEFLSHAADIVYGQFIGSMVTLDKLNSVEPIELGPLGQFFPLGMYNFEITWRVVDGDWRLLNESTPWGSFLMCVSEIHLEPVGPPLPVIQVPWFN